MARTPTPLVRAVVIAVGVVILQALLLLWFSWPAKETAPRDVPVIVAGPPAAAATFADHLTAQAPDAFAVTTAPDAATADAGLRDRKAYAAFVLGAGGVSLHVASAASPTVATLLTQAVQQLGNGQPVPVVDIVASPVDDPRGLGFASGFLPLLLTSLAYGAALLFAVSSPVARLVGVAAFAVAAGLVAAGVMHGLGLLAGSYLAAAGAIALLALAVTGAVTGLGAVGGNAGIGLSVLVVFLLGNPISALATAPELLPQPWGTVGQFLPLGSGATLLRSAAFFGGAGSTRALSVLAVWAVVGLSLTAVGRFRPRTTATAPAEG